MSVLQVHELRKSYKRGFIPKTYEVLKGVSFTLPSRTITGFLGGNGAGKTTTIKCIMGLAYPNSGHITYFDNQPISEKVKNRIGFLPERPYFYEYLTGQEFLQFYGEISMKIKRADLNLKIDKLLKRVDMMHAKDKRLREYSKGMLQKIGLAQALIHDPELVILDEPMSGLDPDGRYYLAEIIREIANEGRSVFFSSHLLPDAEALCQRLVILKSGHISFEGELDQFLQKMGDAAMVTYIRNGHKETARAEDDEKLQKMLGELISQGAKIEGVKRDRNLELAFIKMGLRSGDMND
jgi:ABC-2 type transport system ATP-binding protein